jgi:signal transduction histidine kinase
MGLLPCLRRGSDRWWLPQTERSTDAIGHLLLMDRRSGGNIPPVDGAIRERVCHALQSDPAYFIFAALSYPEPGPLELQKLATWHAHTITGQIASGDAYLGAPKITPIIEKRWRKLTDHFRTIPTSRWMEDAALWLEVTGPNVSNTWREQWPLIRINPDTDSTSTPQNNNHSMLQELARSVQHQKSLENAFDARLQGEKLAAIKQLAYGLSHEINNPLANISTRAEQLQRGETDPNRTATLQRIIDQVYRAHEMIADLMFYANPPKLEQQTCAPSELLAEVTGSFEEELKRQAIQLQISAESGETHASEREVTADATMVKEAVRALIRNSIDAIGCQGTIILTLRCDSQHVMITVADSGPGLSAQAQKHAFDPYFSGREAGRGLGLGLCRAYRIAKLHEGDVSLASGPSGCIATLTLPIAPSA